VIRLGRCHYLPACHPTDTLDLRPRPPCTGEERFVPFYQEDPGMVRDMNKSASGMMTVGHPMHLVSALALASLGLLLVLAPPARAQEPFLGEIRIVPYNFAPRGWAFCEGQLLSIAQNTALFSLLGTTYGGNGQTTFALPDLRGRVPVGEGQGPGLSMYDLGQVSGEENHTLTVGELPPHTHGATAHAGNGSSDSPGGLLVARNPAGIPAYGAGADAALAPDAIGLTGGGQPHNNMQPYLVLHYIIALEGIYPSRN
jgi:microcystin-dependent protein